MPRFFQPRMFPGRSFNVVAISAATSFAFATPRISATFSNGSLMAFVRGILFLTSVASCC